MEYCSENKTRYLHHEPDKYWIVFPGEFWLLFQLRRFFPTFTCFSVLYSYFQINKCLDLLYFYTFVLLVSFYMFSELEKSDYDNEPLGWTGEFYFFNKYKFLKTIINNILTTHLRLICIIIVKCIMWNRQLSLSCPINEIVSIILAQQFHDRQITNIDYW